MNNLSDQPDGPRPGQTLELTVAEAAHGGWCVARIGNPAAGEQDQGKVVFVRHALPGERVRARVTSSTARFARADAIEILEPAPGRAQPPCRFARPGGCGGCDLQHATPATQRALKAQVVAQQLRRMAGIDREVEVEELPGTGSAPGLGWRTRVGFAVNRGGVAGLHKHRSRDVVAIDDCLIAHPLVREAGVARQRWPGAQSVEVAVSPGTAERSVTVTGRGRTIQPGRPLTQHAAGRSWRVSNGVFWQVHPAAADTLATAVLAALDPRPGDTALDLYCGAGLFTGVLAEAVGPAGLVTGVESEVAAVRDARKNLAACPQARVHRGDSTETLEQRGLGNATLAVLDPPRTGATPRLIELLAGPASPLRRIAYVSCDPATLARDIAAFATHGWNLTALRAFDAFPMTHHIECLATLTRNQRS